MQDLLLSLHTPPEETASTQALLPIRHMLWYRGQRTDFTRAESGWDRFPHITGPDRTRRWGSSNVPSSVLRAPASARRVRRPLAYRHQRSRRSSEPPVSDSRAPGRVTARVARPVPEGSGAVERDAGENPVGTRTDPCGPGIRAGSWELCQRWRGAGGLGARPAGHREWELAKNREHSPYHRRPPY